VVPERRTFKRKHRSAKLKHLPPAGSLQKRTVTPSPAALKPVAPKPQRSPRRQRVAFPFWLRWVIVCTLGFIGGASCATLLAAAQQHLQGNLSPGAGLTTLQTANYGQTPPTGTAKINRPQLSPLPAAQEVWECEVAVIGGSLGGVAAASQAMQAGATTCVIELAPWLGGQISSQGVSAIDESRAMLADQSFSESWLAFKDLIQQQTVELPAGLKSAGKHQVANINSCWVGKLCFPPQAGAAASVQLLESLTAKAPGSRWGTSIAFKGAEFDPSGTEITAVYAVKRIPRQPGYGPQGRLSLELASWYSWNADDTFEKVPMRLQAPAGKRMIVIDATDTGEFIAWANVPHRIGTESRATTGEPSASERDNPDCTQAFTYPFVMAIHDDNGLSLSALAQLKPDYSREEHRRAYDLEGFPMFSGRSFFNYRRIVSTTLSDPSEGTPAIGDLTMVNWNAGNDWSWMNPPVVMTDEQLVQSGQQKNWLGGLSVVALKHGENHALLFAEWLMKTQAKPDFPLAFLAGANAPMGTASGLSMIPYIREGRRIIGRNAYGQREFMVREGDLRRDLEGRDFSATAIGVAHYAIDMHGCKYRNWEPSGEAAAAPAQEMIVRPVQLPLESLIPQQVDNLLMGGKGIAVTHIANAMTRIHAGEWTIGAAAGATAGWLVRSQPALKPAEIIPQQKMSALQKQLIAQGLRLEW
jgi:hypothetical protein